MAHITTAQQGLKAVEERDWETAILKLNSSLAVSENPAWLLARAKALAGLKRYQEALEDAELAWHRAFSRNKRELLAEAHYRRALALFSLGRLADADACCLYAMRLIKGHSAVEKLDPASLHVDYEGRWRLTATQAKAEAQTDVFNNPSREGKGLSDAMSPSSQATMWRMASTVRIQALRNMEKLPMDDPARKWATSQKPGLVLLKEREIAWKFDVDDSTEASDRSAADAADAATATAAAAAPVASSGSPSAKPSATASSYEATSLFGPVPPPPETAVWCNTSSLPVSDFQNQSTVSLTIFSKDNDEKDIEVDFAYKSIVVKNVLYPDREARDFKLDLWDEIVPEKSSYTVTGKKIELRMVKKRAGNWPTLRTSLAEAALPVPPPAPPVNPPFSLNILSRGRSALTTPFEGLSVDQRKAASPSLPSAPRGAFTPSFTYPTSSLSGPRNWDDIGKDDEDDEPDINAFFKKLYKTSTPEQQRAMLKSFTESNGTTLSTNWEDVKGRTVETTPPAGVEAKKWE